MVLRGEGGVCICVCGAMGEFRVGVFGSVRYICMILGFFSCWVG